MTKLITGFLLILLLGSTGVAADGKIRTPTEAAQAQLDAYNARDIDAFVAVYSENVKIFSHPNQLRFEGRAELRRRYGPYFENTPDLHANVSKRMVLGDTVIDDEAGIANGKKWHAIAIFHVVIETGEIDKVWFIQ
jgi:hypothetical protein